MATFQLSSAASLNLGWSQNGELGNGLTLSLLMTTQEDFVDIVHQDQTAKNVQSDLISALSTFSF